MARWARRKAAEENTSVSRLVGRMLETQMRMNDEYWRAFRRWKKLRRVDVDAFHRLSREQAQARLWLTMLWEQGTGRLSWQVLHEFYAHAERKMRVARLPARLVVETFVHWQPVEMSLGLVQQAWRWMDQARLSYWDSLIVAAAERAGCLWLLSEDFQTGRTFASVTVLNPFLHSPDEFILKAGQGNLGAR